MLGLKLNHDSEKGPFEISLIADKSRLFPDYVYQVMEPINHLGF